MLTIEWMQTFQLGQSHLPLYMQGAAPFDAMLDPTRACQLFKCPFRSVLKPFELNVWRHGMDSRARWFSKGEIETWKTVPLFCGGPKSTDSKMVNVHEGIVLGWQPFCGVSCVLRNPFELNCNVPLSNSFTVLWLEMKCWILYRSWALSRSAVLSYFVSVWSRDGALCEMCVCVVGAEDFTLGTGVLLRNHVTVLWMHHAL